MILDTSVLIALLREEPETTQYLQIMNDGYGTLKLSAANYLEAAVVVDANDDKVLSDKLDSVLRHFAVDIVPVTGEQAIVARIAYRQFGKGRHPARLNYGDCFAYALAKAMDEPLLFKGDDFTHTDIRRAIG